MLIDNEKLNTFLKTKTNMSKSNLLALQNSLESVLNTELTQKRATKLFYQPAFFDCLILPICERVYAIKVEGEEVEAKTLLGEDLSSSPVNKLIFASYRPRMRVVEVDALWGLQTLPDELYPLVGYLSEGYGKEAVASKQIEDYRVSYFAPNQQHEFAKFKKVINKFRYQPLGVRHGGF